MPERRLPCASRLPALGQLCKDGGTIGLSHEAIPPMKRLILIRHAKSSWDDPTMTDHDRPLNARGKTAASDLGQWLSSRGYAPDQILCSDALRTLETFGGLSAAFTGLPEAELKASLYHAGPDVMLAVLRQAKGDVVMMLGHNPGIAEFAHRLVSKTPLSPQFTRYPTGATLVVDFTTESWADLGFGQGVPADFIVPREIVV